MARVIGVKHKGRPVAQGYKAHVGADGNMGLVVEIAVTPAPLPKLNQELLILVTRDEGGSFPLYGRCFASRLVLMGKAE